MSGSGSGQGQGQGQGGSVRVGDSARVHDSVRSGARACEGARIFSNAINYVVERFTTFFLPLSVLLPNSGSGRLPRTGGAPTGVPRRLPASLLLPLP